MNKNIKYLAIIISTVLLSCNNSKTEKANNTGKMVAQSDIKKSEGYKLLESKCYICHFKTPDPANINQMIAPPMLRVQEHYKPSYPEKEDFIKAVMAYVNNPSEDKTLMPGAVKKFNLMPKVIYNQNELKLIAETIYNYEFGSAPKVRMQMLRGVQLNNGERWKLKHETIEIVDNIINKLYTFKSDNIADYSQFGKDIFEQAKFIMLDKSYTGTKFEQIHVFFNGAEKDMHSLIEEKSIDNAKKTIEDLKIKFNNFYDFFEVDSPTANNKYSEYRN
ncbi:hypothetical protein [Lutibacter sp.]|uniref:hypothetical protein n=1 Tax=Lutibacter sp. TaxID=1925666 RepID=UPI0025BE1924|nr:hypothetical protein [Lutibacter sp.]MCF6167245.1 hypothetical protein [Lutibacter sp.]